MYTILLTVLLEQSCGSWGNKAAELAMARANGVPLSVARYYNNADIARARGKAGSTIQTAADEAFAKSLLEEAYKSTEDPNKFGRAVYDKCMAATGGNKT